MSKGISTIRTALGALAGMAAAAQAQTADASPAPAMTLLDMWRAGGWPMYALAFLSIVAVAFIVYLLAVLRTGQAVPERLHRTLLDLIRRREIDEARRTCEARPCPLSAITLVALDYCRSSDQFDPLLLKDAVEGEGSRQAAGFMGQVQYLFDIAVLSPMVGLLGTVFGMISAFHATAYDLAKAKPLLLAAGVSQALVATATGLLVGIPAMAFYAFFRGRASALISRLESAAHELMTALIRKSTP